MKYFRIILLVIISINLQAQNGGNTSAEQIKLPDLVTPSPQAAELSKYGNVPLNESAGVANVSIPLPEYKMGDLSVPLNLTYSGDGVKVEEVPTWTGIDWNLNVGGVITRVVKDLPDDYNKPRFFYSRTDLDSFKQYITTVGCCDTSFNPLDPFDDYCDNPVITNHIGYYTITPQPNQECEYLSLYTGVFINNPNLYPLYKYLEEYDSLNDEFQFSFPGYSGTFIMKKNASGVFEAKLLKYDSELKIEVIGEFKNTSDYQFLITTPEGVKYYFGGDTLEPGATIFNNTIATESSQFIDRSISPPIFGKSAKTSFYLTKIEHFKGSKIFLEYETNQDYEVHSRRNQKITVPMFETISGNTGDLFRSNLVRNRITNGKFLKRIWNNRDNSTLLFDSFSVIRTENNLSNVLKYRVLKNINYGDISVVFDYNKTYNSLQNGISDKFFVKQVTKVSNDNTSKKEVYSLEYQSLNSIPSNDSNGQDYLGFYNGANNTMLVSGQCSKFLKHFLPSSSTTLDQNQLDSANSFLMQRAKMEGVINNFADREPNFELATNGMLKKIIYPTKGYTEFEYEPVDKKLLYKTKTLRIYSNMGGTPLAWNPNSEYTDVNDIGGSIDVNGIPEPSVFTGQQVDVNIAIHVDESVSVVDMDLDYHDFIYLQVKNIQTGNIEEKRYHFPSEVTTSGYSNKDFYTTFRVSLAKNYGYEFKIGFGKQVGGTVTYINDTNYSVFNSTPLYVDASYTYITGVNQNDGLGIRIKRIKDYKDSNSNPTHIKRVYYKTLKEINSNQNEIDPQIYFPLFYGAHLGESGITNDDNPFTLAAGMLDLYSYSKTLDIPSNLGGSIYQYVTISEGGDNFEKGGIEKEFLIVRDKYSEKYLATPFPWYELRYNINTLISDQLANFDDNAKTNNSDYNGLLLSESVWKKENNELYKIKKNKTIYNFNVTGEFFNTGGSLHGKSSDFAPLYGNFWDIQFSLYSHIQRKSKLASNSNKDFIEPVPLSRYFPDELYHGWQTGDIDSDGIFNPDDFDDDFISPAEMATMSEDDIESKYKKIETTQSYQYNSDLTGLPSVVNSTNSSTGEVVTTKNYYPTTSFLSVLLPTPNTVNMIGYNSLKDAHRISTPIQTETYRNNLLLSKQRTVYKNWEENYTSSFPEKIQTAKGNDPLEDRVIYVSYDSKWNPNILKMANGSSVKYVYNNSNQVVMKIENYLPEYNSIAINSADFNDPCYLISRFPNSFATVYTFNSFTKLLTEVKDPNCKSTFYIYDELHRLKQIKDNENKVIKEFDINYRPN